MPGSLVSLLRDSPIEEVVRKAAWTIGICVANEDMAKEVNKHGYVAIVTTQSNHSNHSYKLAWILLQLTRELKSQKNKF